jgi:hypothetical protein
MAKASKEIPSQERGKTCINRAMPANFKHLAVKELEPLAVIYRQLPAAVALRVRSANSLLDGLDRSAKAEMPFNSWERLHAEPIRATAVPTQAPAAILPGRPNVRLPWPERVGIGLNLLRYRCLPA